MAALRQAAQDMVHEFDFALQNTGRFLYRRSVGGQQEEITESRFDVSDMVLSHLASRPLGLLEADLRDVALALHLADRLALRRIPGKRDRSDLRHARRMRVRLGVRCVERWNDAAVRDTLTQYLHSNTGDTWELEFVLHRQSLSASEQQQSLSFDAGAILRQRWPRLIIALFSAGLDSTAGLAYQLRQNPDSRLLLVSVNSGPNAMQRQRTVLDELPSEVRGRVQHIALELHLHQANENRRNTRQHGLTLRTRGLLFLSAGTLVARMAGRDRFFVYENGIGAFNLSFDRSQLTGQANRAVHPRSLALFGRFATALFRQTMHIENPYQFQTKGELCQALNTPEWVHLIPKTFTCGYPQRVPNQAKKQGIWHCGTCHSCWLRRQGLRVAGLSQDDTQFYVSDLARPETVSAGKRTEWIAIQLQFRRLSRALAASDEETAWRALVREFPEFLETQQDMAAAQPLSAVEVRRGILRLYRTYIAEGLELAPAALHILPQEEAELDTSAGQMRLFA